MTSRGTSVAYTFERFRVDCRGSRVDGRRSMIDGRWLRVVVLSLGLHAIVARNVCYVDVRAVWLIFHVASGIRTTTTISDAWSHVDRHGLSEIGRSPVRANWKTMHSVARSLACERGAFFACGASVASER